MWDHFFLCSFSCLWFGRSLEENLILYLKFTFPFLSNLWWVTNTTSLRAHCTLLINFINVIFYFYRFFHFPPWSVPSSLQKRRKRICLVWAVPTSTESLIPSRERVLTTYQTPLFVWKEKLSLFKILLQMVCLQSWQIWLHPPLPGSQNIIFTDNLVWWGLSLSLLIPNIFISFLRICKVLALFIFSLQYKSQILKLLFKLNFNRFGAFIQLISLTNFFRYNTSQGQILRN